MGRFWVFFLSHSAPGFQPWFYFHVCMWIIHWVLLLRLPWRTWSAPVRARCGGGAAVWVAGVLAAPGTQGSWRLKQQEIQCSRRLWQPVLANTLQCSCLPCPQLSELVRFLLWELSVSFYILHRHRVCLVDHVDLICSLYSWWEGFGSCSLTTLPLGFNCGFISTSVCGLSTGVCT